MRRTIPGRGRRGIERTSPTIENEPAAESQEEETAQAASPSGKPMRAAKIRIISGTIPHHTWTESGEIEQVTYRPGALLWAARASDITRAAVVKLPSMKIYQDMTVRNLNTTRKLYELMKKTAEA